MEIDSLFVGFLTGSSLASFLVTLIFYRKDCAMNAQMMNTLADLIAKNETTMEGMTEALFQVKLALSKELPALISAIRSGMEKVPMFERRMEWLEKQLGKDSE